MPKEMDIADTTDTVFSLAKRELGNQEVDEETLASALELACQQHPDFPTPDQFIRYGLNRNVLGYAKIPRKDEHEPAVYVFSANMQHVHEQSEKATEEHKNYAATLTDLLRAKDLKTTI